MNLLQQFGWILFFSLIGELISLFLPLPIPGSVIGMLLLFSALHFDWLKMEKVEQVGTWLTQNMAILFVPAGVGLMVYLDLLVSIWWQIIIICILSTSFVIISVGKAVQKFKQLRGQKFNEREAEIYE
ncbi:CidA/LrgA family protein [Marinilactibacillus piezotolerans]|uniref:CidA/LrgA family protein n=1 Tax=Marinilactibacillus piezotolerans TaxID=258723 RepID=UPI0009B0C7D9|nr:CidA/LrgA family protein [Marinilactibacillus piezotolerans]